MTPDPLARLGALFARLDPIPEAISSAAANAGAAAVPAGRRLAALRPPGGPVRGPGHPLHFGLPGLRLDLHLEPAFGAVRLTGLLHAADPADWQITAGSRSARPDRVGRFELPSLPRGPLRLTATHPTAAPVHTPWFVA